MIKDIRLAELSDLSRMMEIFDHSRQIMRDSGNLNQWTNGYPSVELMTDEINQRHAYVMTNGDDQVVAVFCFIQGPDPTYSYIEDGTWTDNEPYYVIHRLATDGSERGVAAYCFDWCYRRWPKLRVDTHADNHIMQHILSRCGFVRCGIIYLANGDPRIAYLK